ncbi:metalloregulator ArsR/SmtB family transcription factor [Marinomonas ostreistagni]|uniref:metalloregulator ArsR/SmtB family transcription factor n=1 Tax=Marinomonas ostreistagni TaxID=359209 RepID=UPI00195028F8|nr:metalloregulator ArsR/SmtB family transcription factor [Marinomonas ostreistagni]MBM6550864.1 metalloregulator ArsR/SmtB family transcription factor [Marinomonas ostreistagni]
MSEPLELELNPLSFYKCLADDTRLRCLLLIQLEQELCVCELMAAIDESQPKISRHLAQLRSCGLLTDRRQGQWVFYSLNETLPDWAKLVLQLSAAENLDYVAADLSRLAQMGDRPERAQSCCA